MRGIVRKIVLVGAFALIAPEVMAQSGNDGAEQADLCVKPATRQMASLCRASALLRGRWTAQNYGGTIEIAMQPDGTLAGKIVDPSRYMRDHNYRQGMVFLRGWRPRGGSSVWASYAMGGEVFVPRQPNYRPDEYAGRDSWNKGGVVHVGTARPLLLSLPGSNWFSNSHYFVRAEPL